MMKYPFSDKSKYMVKYLSLSPVVALIMSVGLTTQLVNGAQDVFMAKISFVAFLFLYATGIYSCYLAYKMLTKPGISACVRSLILKRHTAGISVFFICNLYVFAYSIQASFGISDPES